MGKIVAIGGGDVKKKSTLAIDREIIRLSGKRHPHLLFVPTASQDSSGYWNVISKHFKALGCQTDVLFLVSENPSYAQIKRK